MSQTISVSTTMGEQGFRDFAVFDAFHHRKAWLRPAVFAAIMLAFAAVCLSQLGKRPGAGLLAAVLAEYDVPAEQAKADIADFLHQLRRLGCLEE